MNGVRMVVERATVQPAVAIHWVDYCLSNQCASLICDCCSGVVPIVRTTGTRQWSTAQRCIDQLLMPCVRALVYLRIDSIRKQLSVMNIEQTTVTHVHNFTHAYTWVEPFVAQILHRSQWKKKNMNEMNDNKCDRKTRKYIFNELNCFAWMRRSNCRLLNALNTSSSLSFQLFYLPHSNEERIKLHWAIFELDSNSIRSRYTSEGQTIDSCWNYSLEFILHFG